MMEQEMIQELDKAQLPRRPHKGPVSAMVRVRALSRREASRRVPKSKLHLIFHQNFIEIHHRTSSNIIFGHHRPSSIYQHQPNHQKSSKSIKIHQIHQQPSSTIIAHHYPSIIIINTSLLTSQYLFEPHTIRDDTR